MAVTDICSPAPGVPPPLLSTAQLLISNMLTQSLNVSFLRLLITRHCLQTRMRQTSKGAGSHDPWLCTINTPWDQIVSVFTFRFFNTMVTLFLGGGGSGGSNHPSSYGVQPF